MFQNEINFFEWIEINEKFGIWTGGSSCWLNFLRTFKTEFFPWWWRRWRWMESPYSSLACPLLFLSSLLAVLSSLEPKGSTFFSLALECFGVYTTIGVYFISEMRRMKGGRLSSSWIIFKNGRGNRISARTTLKTVPLTVSKSSLHLNNQNSNKEKSRTLRPYQIE